jgi:hypothetical protein
MIITDNGIDPAIALQLEKLGAEIVIV